MRVARAHLLVLFLMAGFHALRAQTNFYTITTNGPASNRVNIVFLAEGYRTTEYGQFQIDVTNAANILLTNSPYTDYRSNFNVFAIAPPSTQSGSDHPANNTFSNTFFSSAYDMFNDYYIGIPTGTTGQGRVTSLLNTFMPQYDLAILLVNDSSPGGSDGGGTTAVVSRGALFVVPSYIDILVHETGHVLAGLGDEYTTAYSYPDVEEPNTTRETNRVAIKWNAWISTNTPVPTPPTFEYLNTVGLFEGAHYHTNGWFRPRINCMMGNFNSDFCEVCKEAMVLAFYRQARPVDAFAPVATNINTTSNISLVFNVTRLQPVSHALSVQWLTNGIAVAGATNTSFSIFPLALGNGTNTVAARVADPTTFVRTDTSNLLSQTITWNVTASVPQLQLSAPKMLSGGKFTFKISGVAPAGFSIHASTNLMTWSAVSTNTLVAGQFNYTNTTATNLARRFYRAATPPQP